jgi:hypothetical protein
VSLFCKILSNFNALILILILSEDLSWRPLPLISIDYLIDFLESVFNFVLG